MGVENNNVSGQNHDPEQIDLIYWPNYSVAR